MVARTAVGLGVATAILVATAALYRPMREIVVDFEHAYEGGLVSEFHDREGAEGSYFRWTRAVSYLAFHHLPARGDVDVVVRLRVRRPPGEPLPKLAFTANRVTVLRRAGFAGTGTVHLNVPEPGSRLRLGIRSDTFDPSGTRPLGVQVLEVTLRFGQAPSWVEPAAWMALAAAVLFGAALVAGAPSLWAAGSALAFSLGFLYLLAQHGLPFSAYPRQVAAISVATFLVAWVSRRLSHGRGVLMRGTIAFLFLLEMTLVFYPLRVSSDAQFQANRMEHFLEGDWHPTSVTQHELPFDIPYPPSLYAVATPLALLGIDRVTALSFTTGLFDVVVSLVILVLAWRFLEDLRAGVIAALSYQLVPMNLLSFSAGNFTNLFAVAMWTLAFWALFRRPWVSAAFTVLAMTAHFGMLMEALVLWPLWLGALWLGPTPAAPEHRKRLTMAVAIGFGLVFVYYLGYWELFARQWERAIWGGAGENGAGGARVAGLAVAVEQLGGVFITVAGIGALTLLWRPFESTFSRAAALWLGVTGLFLLVDLVSPLEIRYVLQALPLLALLAGSYLSRAFERGRLGTTAASAAILYMVAVGARTFHDVLLVRYH